MGLLDGTGPRRGQGAPASFPTHSLLDPGPDRSLGYRPLLAAGPSGPAGGLAQSQIQPTPVRAVRAQLIASAAPARGSVSAIRSRCSTIPNPQLGLEDIRNIVFNETQSLKGDDLPLARIQMAQAIMNADDCWGPRRKGYAKTQPTTLDPLDPRQKRILQDIGAAVQAAAAFRTLGFDTVNGATNYNLRTRPREAPPSRGETFTAEDARGPYADHQSNRSPPKYINTWHNPQGG